MIDGRVKAGRGSGPKRGYDGAERIAWRKRHFLVDTNGLILTAQFRRAYWDGGRWLLDEDL